MGTSFWSAATAGKYFNAIGLANILFVVTFLDAVLLQRASSISTQRPVSPTILHPAAATELPSGYSGTTIGYGGIGSSEAHLGGYIPITLLSREFAGVMNDYTSNSPMIFNSSGCLD